MPTEKQVRQAIKKLDEARDALEPLLSIENPRDGVFKLRSDLSEYADYLEKATWWRKKPREAA